MTIDVLRRFFLWCTVINFGLFFISFLYVTLARSFIYRMHGKWYKLSEDNFNSTIYSAMAFYKIFIVIFNLVPYIALVIII